VSAPSQAKIMATGTSGRRAFKIGRRSKTLIQTALSSAEGTDAVEMRTVVAGALNYPFGRAYIRGGLIRHRPIGPS